MTLLVCNAEEAEVVGHHASIVLGQIRFWLYKANNGDNRYAVTRGGQRWLAHSKDQLCEETRLSPRQMRDALAKLKKHDFIRVEQHLFHGKNVCHFQAAKEGRLTEKAPTEMAQEAPPAADKSAHPESDSDGQLIEKENDLEIGGDYGAQNAPISSGKKKEKSNSDEKCDGGPTHDDGVTPSKLSSVFRGAWDETYPGSFLPAFDGKDMGQFKNLLQRCPDGLGAAIVDHTVRQWHAFCAYACSTEGAFNLPNMPHLGTLLKFVQSASNLYMEQREAVAKAAQKQSPKYVPPQPTKAPEKPSEKATLEQVAAILGKKLD